MVDNYLTKTNRSTTKIPLILLTICSQVFGYIIFLHELQIFHGVYINEVFIDHLNITVMYLHS